MGSSVVSLADLLETAPDAEVAGTDAARLLRIFYDRIYMPAFPDVEERENYADWIAQLANPEKHLYRLYPEILLTSDGEVAAGLLWEYYPKSNSVLATYIATDPAKRMQGIAETLIAAMRDRVHALASQTGKPAAIIYAEAREPAKTEAVFLQADINRLHILHKLGFSLLDVEYIQPPLEIGAPYCDHLVLLCHESSAVKGRVPATSLGAFLDEFFETLRARTGAAQSEEWKKIRARIASTNDIPVLSLDDFAGKFHRTENIP